MGNKQFELLVEKHSLNASLLYGSNALAGEAGEVCNVIKKLQMIDMNPNWIADNQNTMGMPTAEQFEDQLDDELSDVLFYLTRISLSRGLTIEDLMKKQCAKLSQQSIKYNRTFLK